MILTLSIITLMSNPLCIRKILSFILTRSVTISLMSRPLYIQWMSLMSRPVCIQGLSQYHFLSRPFCVQQIHPFVSTLSVITLMSRPLCIQWIHPFIVTRPVTISLTPRPLCIQWIMSPCPFYIQRIRPFTLAIHAITRQSTNEFTPSP